MTNNYNFPAQHHAIAKTSGKRKSQRTGAFKGGIQKGQSATTKESKLTEGIVSGYITEHLDDILSLYPNLKWKGFLSRKEFRNVSHMINPAMPTAPHPDGGLFYYGYLNATAQIVLAVECKYQGRAGNAFQRWAHNALCFVDKNGINAKRYMTVFGGEGFFNGNSSELDLNRAMRHEKKTWRNDEGHFGNYRYASADEEKELFGKDLFHELDLATGSLQIHTSNQ